MQLVLLADKWLSAPDKRKNAGETSIRCSYYEINASLFCLFSTNQTAVRQLFIYLPFFVSF